MRLCCRCPPCHRLHHHHHHHRIVLVEWSFPSPRFLCSGHSLNAALSRAKVLCKVQGLLGASHLWVLLGFLCSHDGGEGERVLEGVGTELQEQPTAFGSLLSSSHFIWVPL